MSLAIDLHDVRKTYRGRIRALDGVEMQVHPGEVFGLLGPNGAGKSTLVKIMMTVVRPTHVKGTMLGRHIEGLGLTVHTGAATEAVLGDTHVTGLALKDSDPVDADLVVFSAGIRPRDALARDVWSETARSTPLDNVIDVHVARLRRKIDLEGMTKLIHTIRGVGFILREGEP